MVITWEVVTSNFEMQKSTTQTSNAWTRLRLRIWDCKDLSGRIGPRVAWINGIYLLHYDYDERFKPLGYLIISQSETNPGFVVQLPKVTIQPRNHRTYIGLQSVPWYWSSHPPHMHLKRSKTRSTFWGPSSSVGCGVSHNSGPHSRLCSTKLGWPTGTSFRIEHAIIRI